MADHYVAEIGSATWAQSTNISTPCSKYTASVGVAAGDTIYMRAGTYTTADNSSVIYMRNSGTSGSRIIWQNYNDEEVILRGQVNGIFFGTQQYITVDGIDIDNVSRATSVMQYGIRFYAGQHNIVQNCTIRYMKNVEVARAVEFGSGCHYNSLIDCTCEYGGITEAEGNDGGDLIYMDGTHNLVQGCISRYSGHDTLLLGGDYNIVRNSEFYNTGWGRTLQTANPNETHRQLFENNVVHDSGDHTDLGYPNSNIQIEASNTIWRRNRIYNALGSSICMMAFVDYQSDDVKIYHNVIYNGGTEHHSYYSYGMNIYESAADIYQRLKVINNIFYKNYKRDPVTDIFLEPIYAWPDTDEITNVGNHWDNDGDPLFTNEGTYDFTLQSGSPCIDSGTWLTYTNGTGSGSTTLIVDDSVFFCDGWGVITGDTIQLQGQTDTAVISSINYATNTLTLATPLTWGDGVGVALTYSGTAPDQGAYEYGGSGGVLVSPNVIGGHLDLLADTISTGLILGFDYHTLTATIPDCTVSTEGGITHAISYPSVQSLLSAIQVCSVSSQQILAMTTAQQLRATLPTCTVVAQGVIPMRSDVTIRLGE